MTEETQDIEKLILLYLKNELTDQQQMVLTAWVNQSDENKKLYDSLTNREQLLEKLIDYYHIETATKKQNKARQLLSKILQ